MICFIIGQVFKVDSAIAEKLSISRKVSLFTISFMIFFPLLKSMDGVDKLFKILKLYFLNCALIVLGFVLDIIVFRTYLSFKRFGYMGIYNSNNQASFYFILMIIGYIIKFLNPIKLLHW